VTPPDLLLGSGAPTAFFLREVVAGGSLRSPPRAARIRSCSSLSVLRGSEPDDVVMVLPFESGDQFRGSAFSSSGNASIFLMESHASGFLFQNQSPSLSPKPKACHSVAVRERNVGMVWDLKARVHIDGIKRRKFEPCPGDSCGQCSYGNICREEVRWTSRGILSYHINNHNDQKGGGATVKRGDMV